MMTMHERIAAGKLFTDECEGLPQERTAAKLKMNAFNASSPADPEARAAGMPVGGGGNLDWERLVRESGLAVISLHQELGSVERDPAAVAEEAKRFGTDTVVITGMSRYDYSSEKAVRELARRLNAAGRALKELAPAVRNIAVGGAVLR